MKKNFVFIFLLIFVSISVHANNMDWEPVVWEMHWNDPELGQNPAPIGATVTIESGEIS